MPRTGQKASLLGACPGAALIYLAGALLIRRPGAKVKLPSRTHLPTIAMTYSRRSFVIHSFSATGALAASGLALAQTAAPALVKDTDANAVALGYKTDGSKTDVKKYPKYAAGQNYKNCGTVPGSRERRISC